MVDLDVLQNPKVDKSSSQQDLSQPLFDTIAALVEKEEIENAKKMIQEVLLEGNLDIRLIVYYLYAHFVEEGIKSFSTTLPLLQTLLENHWESLKPHHRKERQVENSLNWFFAHHLDKLKYGEKLAKEGKKSSLWEKALGISEADFQHLLETARNFQDFFYEKWGQSQTKERVTHLVKKIEDLQPFLFVERQEERLSLHLEDQKPAPSEALGKAISSSATPEEPLYSPSMQSLMLKLKIFETLLEKKEYLKAAMVCQDITFIMEHFDPSIYFPKLFSEYFALLAKHISTLAEEWQNQESLQWKSLQKLYSTDIDRFVKW